MLDGKGWSLSGRGSRVYRTDIDDTKKAKTGGTIVALCDQYMARVGSKECMCGQRVVHPLSVRSDRLTHALEEE